MPRTKSLNQGKEKDGKHRKETKEERRARLQGQEDARQACEKLIPSIAAAVVIFLLIFAIYVKSVPPKDSSARLLNEATLSPLEQQQFEMMMQQQAAAAASGGGGGGDAAESAAANQAALDEAMRMLKDREKQGKTKEEEVMEL